MPEYAFVGLPVCGVAVHVDGDQGKSLVAPAGQVGAQLGQAVAADGAGGRPEKDDGDLAAQALLRGKLFSSQVGGLQR